VVYDITNDAVSGKLADDCLDSFRLQHFDPRERC
jgi:hypothetical protein